MQIAGSTCRTCGRNIVLADEGRFCPGCAAYAHFSCEPEDQCRLCGQTFQVQERVIPNLPRDAILPSALRPANSFGAILLLIAGLALAAIVFGWLLVYSFTHMHDSM